MSDALPKSYKCQDCGAFWSEKNAVRCFHCLSDNIFIFWQPGKKSPIRYKLLIKKYKLITKDK